MITDPKHLDRIVTDIVRQAAALSAAWVNEDADSCAPRASGGGRTSNVAADPTGAIANTNGRTRHRDHVGSTLLHVHRRMADLLAELTPRMPTRNCRCCDREMATHGRDVEGKPTACWACDMYLRRTGYRCDAEVHDDRPRVRMCDCSESCCEAGTCPDRAAEGRSVSERCKKRMQRKSEAA